MKKVMILICVIAILVLLVACGATKAYAEGSYDTLENYVVKEVASNGEICVLTPFYGGDVKEDIFGYIAKVWDADQGITTITTYVVYVEVEELHWNGMYLKDEIEIDADYAFVEAYWTR